MSKKVVIALGIIVALLIVGIVIRTINMSKKQEVTQPPVESTADSGGTEDEATKPAEPEKFESSLTASAKEEEREKEEVEQRLKEKEEAEEKAKKEEEERLKAEKAKPTYGDAVKIWDSDGVPDIMEDGRSIKQYFKDTSIASFGSNWGTALDNKDKLTDSFYMVGVDQNPEDKVTGVQSQSFGWLITHLGGINKNSAIKFTDLNVVDSYASDHVAMLCCYNWYSIWGLEETMMFFEDISRTLKPSDFKPGTIFSAIVYAHNIKVVEANGQKVICVQYNTFK